MTPLTTTPLGCVPGGFFAFWTGAIFPGFPSKDPIADSRGVKSIGRDVPLPGIESAHR